MRGVMLSALVITAIGASSIEARAACNIRGEFCGYPAWAANAFSAPRDRVPDWVLENPPGKNVNQTKRYGYRRAR
jgi:hypothetical protein